MFDKHAPRARRLWPLLLAIPIAVALIPGIYNQRHPALIGIPFFYWLQIALVLAGGLLTTLVYLRTRPPRNGGDGGDGAAGRGDDDR